MGSREESDVVQLARAEGAFFGLAVGDALGAHLEFTRRDSRPPVRDLVGGGPFDLKPGQWTDDTSMALCLADSLIVCGGFDETDLMQRFVRWWREGKNSVTGRCFDIGITTRTSLDAFMRTGKSARHGLADPSQAGNGSLMRLAPVAIFAAPDRALAEDLADRQSRTTHPAPVAHDACRFFAGLLVDALTGGEKMDILRPRPWSGSVEVAAIAAGTWKTKTRKQISSSGYVISTLEAALWCVGSAETFEDALILAANLGDDSDTVAAVTGQFAGALYGYGEIPDRWCDVIAWKAHISERTRTLLKSSPHRR